MKSKILSFLYKIYRYFWIVGIVIIILFILSIYLRVCQSPQPSIKTVYSNDYDGYPYLIYLPTDYKAYPYQKWPVIIYLHGASLRGNDTSLLKKYGLPDLIQRGEDFDFIIASPQCPAGKTWINDDWFLPFFNEIHAQYRMDTNRVYVTGMSMGGFGTWYLGAEYNKHFAAIAPLCGGGDPDDAEKYRNVAVYAVHGTNDKVIPLQRSQEMVNALKKDNQQVKFTKLKGKGHAIHGFYEKKELYKWFLKHERE